MYIAQTHRHKVTNPLKTFPLHLISRNTQQKRNTKFIKLQIQKVLHQRKFMTLFSSFKAKLIQRRLLTPENSCEPYQSLVTKQSTCCSSHSKPVLLKMLKKNQNHKLLKKKKEDLSRNLDLHCGGQRAQTAKV